MWFEGMHKVFKKIVLQLQKCVGNFGRETLKPNGILFVIYKIFHATYTVFKSGDCLFWVIA